MKDYKVKKTQIAHELLSNGYIKLTTTNHSLCTKLQVKNF